MGNSDLRNALPGMGKDRNPRKRGRCLPNSSVQHHGDRDVEVAQGFGHFLTEGDILRTLDKV